MLFAGKDRTGDYYIKWDNPNSERQLEHGFCSYMESISKKNNITW
jgi:hypothetical protein